MSNGDDEAADEDEAEASTELSADTLDQRLDEAESDLDAAETEADLDTVEDALDDIEADIEAADLPEPDEDDEDAEDPVAELEDRLSDLRDQLEDQRGPYGEDVVSILEDAQGTVSDTRWTEDGAPDVVTAVQTYLGTVNGELDTDISADSDDTADLADALGEAADAVEDAGLDADEDAETIAALLEDAQTLEDDLDGAEEWDDLTVREQLDAEGFYDVLESKNRKDFPAEWNAVKVYEEVGEVEPIVKALETFDSDFMQENILDTLWRMGPEEAYDAVHQRAQKRNVRPVEILGKIGNEDATETLHDFIDGDGDPALQRVTLRALGEIGSKESVQPVAQRLDADNYEVRSSAARSLGLLGDTRAIEPLSDVLADEEANEVRASAAWALNQIGTQRALDVLEEYTEDRAYLVQAEAEKVA